MLQYVQSAVSDIAYEGRNVNLVARFTLFLCRRDGFTLRARGLACDDRCQFAQVVNLGQSVGGGKRAARVLNCRRKFNVHQAVETKIAQPRSESNLCTWAAGNRCDNVQKPRRVARLLFAG